MRFIDPDGMKIVDTKGKEITYSDGKWSSNATVSTERIGELMMVTPAGSKMFNTLANAAYNVSLNLVQGKSEDGALGSTQIEQNKNGEIISAKITIYEGSINDYMEKLKDIKSSDNSTTTTVCDEATQARLNNMPETTGEVIGQVTVHEGGHITNKMGHKPVNPDHNSRENIARKPEIEAIKETSENRYKLPHKIEPKKFEP